MEPAGVLPHPTPLPLGEGVTQSVLWCDGSGKRLHPPANFKKSANGCFSPSGRGIKGEGENTATPNAAKFFLKTLYDSTTLEISPDLSCVRMRCPGFT